MSTRHLTSSMRLIAAILLLSSIVLGQSTPGERVYKGKCANCHSVDGSAASPLGKRLGLRDLRSPEVQRLSDNDLAEVIAKGRRNMPSFRRQLNDAQLSQVVQYIRSLSKITPVADKPVESK
jgi:mono/diheme cytochrome c family protein